LGGFEQLANDPEALSTTCGDPRRSGMQRGDARHAGTALDGLDDGLSCGDSCRALVIDGQWAAGQAAFEAALKQCKSEIGGSKHLLPDSLAWFYPLSLLAQATPRHLELARKFCVGEVRQARPQPLRGWGRWVHAIDVRLGKDTARAGSVQADSRPPGTRWALDSLWAILLAAWLGSETINAGDPHSRPASGERAIACPAPGSDPAAA
jgi:hypothetical protein